MKKKAPHHENHERWLVSYADFITLLFAFFVVMFATAQKDKTKAKQVAESFKEAVQHGQLTSAITGILNQHRSPPQGKGDSRANPALPPPLIAGNAPPASHEDLVKSLGVLNRGLESEIHSGKVSITLEARGLVISLREAAFFRSGDDNVSPAGFPMIEKISGVIGQLSNPIRLEGHTDSVPIHNSRFRSNWELSTARSIAMLELFRDRYLLRAGRLSVAGYGENAPADTNETEEGRAHNRRVDVVVLSAEALSMEQRAGPKKEEPAGAKK